MFFEAPHSTPPVLKICYMEWYCGLSLLCLSKNMGAFQKILGLVDALGLFLVTRHPFVELFLLLMRTGDNLPEQSGSIPENFVDTVFRREYFMIYLHSVVYFICGTGMTLDMKRRQCGFAAGVHVAVVTAMTLHGSPKMTEYSMVRFWRNSPSPNHHHCLVLRPAFSLLLPFPYYYCSAVSYKLIKFV